MPFVEESIAHSHDMDGSFINTTKNRTNKTDIDEYGNVKKTISLISPENLHIDDEDDSYMYKSTIVTSFEPPDLDYWLISLPRTIITKKYNKEQDNEDIMLKIFEYNKFGTAGWPYVKSVETSPNYSRLLTTNIAFEYDYYGNTTTKTISAPYAKPPLEDRTTYYDYKGIYEGRFLSKKTNIINGVNYVTEYEYYKDKGLLKSETFNPGEGATLLTTSYLYDSFGKVSKVTGADGTYTKTDFSWIPDDVGKESVPPDALFVQSTYNNKIVKGNDDEKTIYNFVFTYYDKFERELSTQKYDRNNRLIVVDKYYYEEDGRLEKVSEPHFSIYQSNIFTKYKYDDIGRVELVTTPAASIKTEYNGRSKKVTNINTSIWKTKTVNAIGLTESIIDPAGTITYQYYSSGNIHKINALGTETIMEYDNAGNQKTLIDPNAGITTYVYNAFGELEEQTDAKQNKTKIYYDNFGRLIAKAITNGETGVSEKTSYLYQERTNIGGFGSVKNVFLSNGISYSYTYDELSRLSTKTETILGADYIHTYAYDSYYGNISTIEYPSGYKIKYDYLNNGFLDKIKDYSTSNMLWKPLTSNGRGQLTDYELGNGLLTHKGFDEFGLPKSIRTSAIPFTIVQDLKYDIDPVTGNLDWRGDNASSTNVLIENFTYDGLLQSRLETWRVNSGYIFGINYESNGNIITKSDVTFWEPPGEYQYGQGAGLHAVTGITNPTPGYRKNATPQIITYTALNKIKTIQQINTEEGEEHKYDMSFVYGPGNARKVTKLTKDRELIKTKLYIGSDYEVELLKDGSIRKLHYLSGGDGLFAIYVLTEKPKTDAVVDETYYIHKDYLGSYETITNSVGKIIEKLSFDPWGRKRNPADWTYTPSPYKSIFDRGYTGHEHMEAFGLINMNGRVYDPWLGRMLSPDPFVQAPTYSQNFNRYSYAFNNPLKYTDPSGEWAILIGAAIGGAVGYISGRAAGLRGSDLAFYTLASAGIGAISGGIGAAVGSAVSVGGSAFVAGMANGAISGAAGGFAGGFMATGINNTFYGRSDNIFVGGAIGAGIGGTIGGITGGIQGLRQNYVFTKGSQALGVMTDDPVPATDSFLNKAQKAWFKDAPMDRVNKFTVENVPSKLQLKMDKANAGAATRPYAKGGLLSGRSSVYFNKNVAFSSAENLYYTMGHELIHVSQFAALAGQPSILLSQSFSYNGASYSFDQWLLEFHAYSYQNSVGGTSLSAFPPSLVREIATKWPNHFSNLNYTNFNWTSTSSFSYSF